MSWLFSQALAVEYLGDTCLDGEPSAPLSGSHTQQAYLSHGKTTGFSRLSRFGMTVKPLTEDRGEELLTLYREGFHARTLVQQGGGQESPENDQECGNTWQGSLARLDPNTSMWKTAQCSLLEDSMSFSLTLPRWGLMLDGELYPQPTLVRPIKENESGLWRTPDTGAGGTSGLLKQGITHRANGQPIQVRLVDQVNNPKMWPTPSTRDHKGGYIGGRIRNGKVSWDTLDVAVQHTDNQSKDGGQLNPTWVEKLMGWPDDWTMLQPISHVKICFWVMGFCDGKETRTREILRVLRVGYATQEIQQEIGRPVSIYETAFLLAELCEHANRPDEARIFMACAEALEEEVRGVRLCDGTTGAPYQPGQGQQRAGEHTDIMQALSRLLAHHGKTAWQEGSWEDAVPRVATGVADRVDRLKAIGNGQVPEVARTAWGLLK